MGMSVPAQVTVTLVGTFSGNDCGAGGFANCYATQSGTQSGAPTDPKALGSPTIYKSGPDGAPEIGNFASITGTEFAITYTASTNTLSFNYTPGAGDPVIHYFDVKQANGFVLFYDPNPITSGTINLSTYFPNNPGYSHITFIDTGAPAVPEPATWAMMLLGFGGIGMAMRRRRRATLQTA